jgi:glutamate synthase (NADPH/NADH) large chain
MVCPNNAIGPMRADETDKLRFHIDRGGQPRRRGGRRNVPGVLLDRLRVHPHFHADRPGARRRPA